MIYVYNMKDNDPNNDSIITQITKYVKADFAQCCTFC